MNCSEVQALLIEFNEEALDIEEDIQLGIHLSECWLCKESMDLVIEDLAVLREELNAVYVETNTAELQYKVQIAQSLRDEELRRKNKKQSVSEWAVPYRALLTACLILTLTMVGSYGVIPNIAAAEESNLLLNPSSALAAPISRHSRRIIMELDG